jgi:hypothetical protein
LAPTTQCWFDPANQLPASRDSPGTHNIRSFFRYRFVLFTDRVDHALSAPHKCVEVPRVSDHSANRAQHFPQVLKRLGIEDQPAPNRSFIWLYVCEDGFELMTSPSRLTDSSYCQMFNQLNSWTGQKIN